MFRCAPFFVPWLLLLAACAGSPTAPASPPKSPATISAIYPVGASVGVEVTILGQSFGDTQGAAELHVGLATATVSSWADDRIVFSMPQGVGGDGVHVQVIRAGRIEADGVMNHWAPGVMQLTDSRYGVGAENPTWSGDGRWIYYTQHVDGEYDIFRVPSTGGPPERLTHTSYDESWPDLNFHSGELAFGMNSTASGNSKGDYDVWIANSDFTGLTPVIASYASEDDLDRAPAWSRSVEVGVRMAYVRVDSSGVSTIMLLNSGGAITKFAIGTNPRFDPLHGDWMLFTDYDYLTPHLYKRKVGQSSSRIELPTPHGFSGDADWGVNGRIVYGTGEFGRDAWVMDADGANPEKLFGRDDTPEYSMRWSPTADRVAFGSHRSGAFDIYVYTLSQGGDTMVPRTEP